MRKNERKSLKTGKKFHKLDDETILAFTTNTHTVTEEGKDKSIETK